MNQDLEQRHCHAVETTVCRRISVCGCPEGMRIDCWSLETVCCSGDEPSTVRCYIDRSHDLYSVECNIIIDSQRNKHTDKPIIVPIRGIVNQENNVIRGGCQ